MKSNSPSCPRAEGASLDRRAMLVGCGAAATLGLAWPLARKVFARSERVFLAKNQRYDGPLAGTIAEGLSAVGVRLQQLRGKTVLLKPNLVEPRRELPHMTTNPAVVAATAEVFVRHGARVVVGEGPGHVRDTEMALIESGLDHALRDGGLQFADLNYEEIAPLANAGGCSQLAEIHFPASIHTADLIVSLPKLKAHHWVGMTAAMKNLYGALPGVKYGWPKNVLHYAGIPQTVVDINATLAAGAKRPRVIGVIDAIECMEGDGPIMGAPKPLGVLAIGANLPALDATCARLMGLAPERIEYLWLAQQLGPLAESRIVQCGEPWRELMSPFDLAHPHLSGLRASV